MEEMRMARNKTISTINSEIAKKQELLAKAKTRYDSLAKEIKTLMSQKQEIQAKEIMTAFIKSGKRRAFHRYNFFLTK
jgi:uncharacterized coiled-coil protein SlyX